MCHLRIAFNAGGPIKYKIRKYIMWLFIREQILQTKASPKNDKDGSKNVQGSSYFSMLAFFMHSLSSLPRGGTLVMAGTLQLIYDKPSCKSLILGKEDTELPGRWGPK